jgi:hypothetical protein
LWDRWLAAVLLNLHNVIEIEAPPRCCPLPPLGASLLQLVPPNFVLSSARLRRSMIEEQEITMCASIWSMEGIGPAALEVFETAGLREMWQLNAFDGEDGKLNDAICKIRNARDCSMWDDAYWRRLFTRCINIIFRARSAEATDYVPHEYMCPLSLDWYHDPVVARSGHSFSRQWIDEHLKHSQTNPMTRGAMCQDELYKNIALQQAVSSYRLNYQRYRIVC